MQVAIRRNVGYLNTEVGGGEGVETDAKGDQYLRLRKAINREGRNTVMIEEEVNLGPPFDLLSGT
jgi:hypothetical protein